MARAPVPVWPWDAVLLEPDEVSLLKAIDVRAFAVIEKICGVGRNPFTAGGEDGRRATDFGAGKLWVGHTLRDARAAKMPSVRKDDGPHAVPKGAPPEN